MKQDALGAGLNRMLLIVAMSSVLGLGGLALDASAQSDTGRMYDSSALIGMRVRNTQGKDIGEIEALLVNARDGRVSHAVVGVGGLLGVGEKHLVVPWSDVSISSDSERANRTVATLDQSLLDRAPRYERPGTESFSSSGGVIDPPDAPAGRP